MLFAGAGGAGTIPRRRSVVVRWVSSVNGDTSFSTRNWCRSRAIAARLCTGVLIALASSLLTVSAAGAQVCDHESASHDTHARPASHNTPAAVERLPQHRAHSPAMHRVLRHAALAPIPHGSQANSSPDCCGEGEGCEPSCPSSCPVGGSCTTHGPLTVLDANGRVTAPAPVNSPGPCRVGEYPDSWSGSLDTPPPRS